MKKFLLVALLVWPLAHFGQAIDSIAWRQVDSLIIVSRDLTRNGHFEQAMEVGALAEKLALEKI